MQPSDKKKGFPLSPPLLLNTLCSKCYGLKFILGRHWIEAEIFPYILRYLGISVLLDPALSATVSATGLYFREGNKYEDLWIEHSDSSGCNLKQKAIVRDLLQLWIPYIQLSDIAASLTSHKNGVTGRLDSLKKVIITGMVMAAKTQLRKKIVREGWSQGISVEWVDLIADAPKKWCNGIARFTLLRWAVNQDDDVWLTLRGTRHKHLCGVQGRPFPAKPDFTTHSDPEIGTVLATPQHVHSQEDCTHWVAFFSKLPCFTFAFGFGFGAGPCTGATYAQHGSTDTVLRCGNILREWPNQQLSLGPGSSDSDTTT